MMGALVKIVVFIFTLLFTYVGVLFPLVSLGISLLFFILCLGPAFVSIHGGVRRPNWSCMPASIAWFLNAGWAWWLSVYVNPIRIDLIIILPLLTILTLQGLVAGFSNKTFNGTAVYGRWGMKLIAGFGVLLFLVAFNTVLNKRPVALIDRLLVGDLGPNADALKDLRELPPKEQEAYVLKLMAALKDEYWNKRLHAVYMLGHIGLPLAAPAIPALQEAGKDENSDVRDGASKVLAVWGYSVTDTKKLNLPYHQ